MQRVCAIGGGVKSYLENPRSPLSDEDNRRCLFCPDGHRLRLHGTYKRQALFPDPEAPRSLTIQRLLCVRTGRTVSLLPDFCLPRRQHGPAILGLFLQALLGGAGVLAALSRFRRDLSHHSTPRSLLKGFLGKAGRIRSYLARLRRRVVEASQGIPRARRLLAFLVQGLLSGFPDPPAAFIHHARRFHQLFRVSLA